MKENVKKHLISLSYLTAVAGGMIYILLRYRVSGPAELLLSGTVYGVFAAHPWILTLLNLIFLSDSMKHPDWTRKGRHVAILTVTEGMLYTILMLPFAQIRLADWEEALVNMQRHTPVWTGGLLTVAALTAVGVTGYLVLSARDIRRMPPLAAVLAIAALYLGMVMCLLWIIQVVSKDYMDLYLCLLPANGVLLGVGLIRRKILLWKSYPPQELPGFRGKWLNRWNERLADSRRWPLAAFLLMWPLLAVLVCLLVLLGQRPDSVVRAWTQTSDWNLSTQTSPPNVFYDEHYLCTVAAGGHRKLVKPLRMGERRGHRVTVNRQLCIANAFEELLQERLPKVHRRLRQFYDRYGFPLARLIRTPFAADVVYLLMKPLEWLFLAALYLFDTRPENRIAVQYLPPALKNKMKENILKEESYLC